MIGHEDVVVHSRVLRAAATVTAVFPPRLSDGPTLGRTRHLARLLCWALLPPHRPRLQ